LTDQLNRASLSFSANIAEGNGRRHAKDRTHFFLIARGSALECVPLLELAKWKGLLEDAFHADLKSRLDEIGAMLSGPMKNKAG